MPENLCQEEAIFHAALAIETPDQRSVYLAEACGNQPELRRRVEALLRRCAEAQGPLDRPVARPAATTDEPSLSESPGTIINSYKLLEQIGEGGFGVVFMAEQHEPIRRKVALKILKPGMDTRQVIARFEAERQALALMDHPHIAKILDAGQTGSGRPYFVMDLVKGLPITEYCDQAQLAPRERLELFVDVCSAVQHAHQKGIIHRDIKPSNVLVTLHDGTPVVKVIDFGIAKALGQQLTDKTLFTGFAQMIGTPLYMSPEQAALSNVDVDTRSDIYSLGVLLYELLTGTTPFDKERLQQVGYDEMRRIIREEEPPRPSTRISTLGQAATTLSTQRKSDPRRLSQLFRGELDWIVMKCLEKDRDRRYESTRAFAADVQRYLHDEPVQACPPSAWYRVRKSVRRNKRAVVMALMATLAALLAVGSIAGSIGWGMRDRAARRTVLEQAVVRALEETENASSRGRVPEASAALKRAEELLTGGECSEALQQRVRQWRADLDLVSRLKEARMLSFQVNVAESRFQEETMIPEYEAAFREYGIDPESMTAPQAAQWIRSRPAENQLAMIGALDEWIANLKGNPQKSKWLVAVVLAADTDPWRARVRQALAGRDFVAVVKLADLPEVVNQPPYTLLQLGRLLCSETVRRRELGRTLLRRAQQVYPGDFWINNQLAWELRAATPRQGVDAVRFAAIAVGLQPDNAGALLNFGSALYEQGMFDEAIAAFRKAIALKPGYAAAHANLGSALARQAKLDQAIEAFRKAIDLKPNDASFLDGLGNVLREQGQLDQAIAAYRKAIELRPDLSALHTNLGVALCKQGKLKEAVTEYRLAIDLEPNGATVHTNLGFALFKQGKLKEAIAEYRLAIDLEPNGAISYLAHTNLGKALAKQGKREEEIAEYRKAIELKPDYAAGHYDLGCALEAQGKLDQAIATFRKAIDLNPNDASYHYNLGTVLIRQGKLELAIAALRRAVTLNPHGGGEHYNLHVAFLRHGQVEEAIAALAKVIDLEPNHALRHMQLAWLLANYPEAKFRNPKRAVELAKKAVALDPKVGQYWHTLGCAHYRAGNWKEAITALQKSMELRRGGNSWEWYFLAMAQWHLGNPEEARGWYQRAVEWMDRHQPDDKDLRRFRTEATELLRLNEKKD